MARFNSIKISGTPALIYQPTGQTKWPVEFSIGDESISTISLQTKRTRLSPTTNNEREIDFQNEAWYSSKTYDADGVRPHGCRIYGGNGSSPVALGFWDSLNGRPIFRYDDVNNILKFEVPLYEGSSKLSDKYAPMPKYIYSGNLDGVSVASKTYTTIASVNMKAGISFIIGHFSFDSNQTGHRKILFENSSTSTGTRNDSIIKAAPGIKTGVLYMRALNLSSDTTLYFRAYQDSGSALSVYACYTIVYFT